MLRLALVTAGLASAVPLGAQSDHRREGVAAALEFAMGSRGLGDIPRSAILLDTLRVGIDPSAAAAVARTLGLRPGVSEDHCRRFWDPDEDTQRASLSPPIGFAVRGVHAIITGRTAGFTPDSGWVNVQVVRGEGRSLGGGVSYLVRRDSREWRAEPRVSSSPHLTCEPKLFTVPLAMAAQTLLEELGSTGAVCLDPTGFFLHEQDSVAALLGARIEGRWMPKVQGETPEPFRDPCAKADTSWGSVVRFVRVEWESDELIRVTVEGQVPGTGRGRVMRFTLMDREGEWSEVSRDLQSGEPPPAQRER